MKVLLYLSFACILFSIAACKDESFVVSKKSSAPGFTPLMRAYSRTDTVRFTGDSSRIAVVGLLQPGAYLEDSSRQLPVDVLYYVNGRQVSAHTDTFNTGDGKELSHYFEGTDTNGNSCERFFTINFGYPACGYSQSHLTFSADKANCYFVAKHISYADGSYGGGLEFFDACNPQTVSVVSSAIINRGSETDSDDILTVTYSDSTIYRFDGKQWKSELLTGKDKVYRTASELL